jgi:uncharacterized protein
MTIRKKYDSLLAGIRKSPSLLVAFSGGADSSLLAFAAAEALGRDKVLAVTALAQTYPGREREDAESFCRAYDIPHRLIATDEVGNINARGNPFDRCYHCKRELFARLQELARAEGFAAVAEGSNTDDGRDYRPGRRALAELGILSPLEAAGFAKADVREVSRALGLPSWDKPPCACLVSRFPYRVPITTEALERIERAEEYLHGRGFRLCRVRHYGDRARVEVERERVEEALGLRDDIATALRSLGYAAVEIDPEGYRTGSMNVFG